MPRLLPLLFAAALLPAQVRLASNALHLSLDRGNGYGIGSLYAPEGHREFIASGVRPPLYRITLSQADGSGRELTSADATSVRVTRCKRSSRSHLNASSSMRRTRNAGV